jgi:signal transduction histidine kinase
VRSMPAKMAVRSMPAKAVAVLVEWEGVTAEQYDEMINRMSVTDIALPGSLVHVAGPAANGWRVFDVWESPEALDRFTRGTLMPILEQAGIPLPKVWTWPVHNALSPPTEEVRASRLRIIAAQNAERRRLERNLHDGAQQSLIALKIKLCLAADLAERDPAKAGELLHELESDAQHALESLRELARGLYPALLEQHGLAAALDAQARKAGIAVVVDATDVRRYAQETEAAVYFSCLEALQNAAKHAKASGLRLRLCERNGRLEVTITDDGVGFDPVSQPGTGGLQNITDRIEAAGGSVQIRSAPGKGTTLTGWVPVTDQGVPHASQEA